jgi:hypothetical protein
MNSDTAIKLSDDTESALSNAHYDLTQLLKQYEISEIFKIDLFDLDGSPIDPRRSCVCNGTYQNPCMCQHSELSLRGLGPDKTLQLCTDISLKLSMIFASISQSFQQAEEKFNVCISINPDTENNSNIMSCKFVEGVLLCTDQL